MSKKDANISFREVRALLESFLFDYKRKISVFNDLTKFLKLEWKRFILLIIGTVLYPITIYSANLIFIAVAVILLIAGVRLTLHPQLSKKRNKGKKTKLHKCSTTKTADSKSKDCEQIQWFLTHRIEVVENLITKDITGLSENEFIDMLVAECDDKLKETRPSEIAKKKIAPVGVLTGIIFTTLFTAYLYNNSLIANQVEGSKSLTEWVLKIMPEISNAIISNENTLILFMILCFCITIIYLTISFIFLPFIVSSIDRDWLLTKELKSILRYIQKKQANA